MIFCNNSAATAPEVHEGQRPLAQRIFATPLFDGAETGRARLKDWLAEIAGTPEGPVLAGMLADQPKAATLLAGVAEASPYLWNLACTDPEGLANTLASDPKSRFDTILARGMESVTAVGDEAEAMRLLRRMKAEASLLVALADIGGVWPVTKVTEALTRLADTGVAGAVRHLLTDAARRGRFRPLDSGRPELGSGYIVLAMGKMGADELNFSSDIDLIVFYDAHAARLPSAIEPAPFFVRLTQRLVAMMQQRTAEGYLFRADLRLRPDPASTQIAVSTAAALDYYESIGQTWERAALIKARPCAGDTAAGEAFLRELSPFVWRKYLDFAAVADVHALKRQIHAYRGHGEIAVEGHNLKLGRGGIREIEFFAQTQQLVAGGRHPELRDRGTLPTLSALAAGGWISAEARDELAAAYCFLRSVEHRLQMMADEQTHTLPADRDQLDRFARFLGFNGRDAFAENLLTHLRNVQRHYAALFEGMPAAEASELHLQFPAAFDDRETLERLALLGFRQPLEASALVRGWLRGDLRSLASAFAREQLGALVPLLIGQFAKSASPDAALIAFDRFLGGLRAAGRLLSLLRENRDLMALLGVVLGTAPRLADALAQLPQVMDAIVDPGFFGAPPNEPDLAESLERSLRQASSYEDFLDRIRVFAQEHMFLIGTRILSGTLSAAQAGAAFAALAEVLIRSLHRRVEGEFAELHGRIPAQECAILALGRLGGREMAATSDLDLIVVYDFDHDRPESDGPRPLYGSQYFARLTQRLISSLTAQTNYGVLYHVDMRLRPSGRSGPLATRLDSFADYQEREAWTWEHMALTRARVIAGSPCLAAKLEAVIRGVLTRARNAKAIARDVTEMRRAIAGEKGDSARWDLKYVAGGLIDIEFVAQHLQLVHAAAVPEILDTSTARVLERAWQLRLISAEDAEVLRGGAKLYHNLDQILRLCLAGPFDSTAAAPELIGLLTRAADVPDFATLEAFLAETQTKVRTSFTRILGMAP